MRVRRAQAQLCPPVIQPFANFYPINSRESLARKPLFHYSKPRAPITNH